MSLISWIIFSCVTQMIKKRISGIMFIYTWNVQSKIVIFAKRMRIDNVSFLLYGYKYWMIKTVPKNPRSKHADIVRYRHAYLILARIPSNVTVTWRCFWLRNYLVFARMPSNVTVTWRCFWLRNYLVFARMPSNVTVTWCCFYDVITWYLLGCLRMLPLHNVVFMTWLLGTCSNAFECYRYITLFLWRDYLVLARMPSNVTVT